MSATNYTPIYLYNSGTATNTPSAANLGTGELAINYADGKLFYKDGSAAIQVIGWKTTPTTAGGTGLTSYTVGDLPYYASGSTLSKLGIGTSGYVLQSNGSAPTWVAQSTLTVGNATNAVNVGTTDNTSSSSTYYPTLVSATSGNNPITTSSTKLSFVPNTGTLTATQFNGLFVGSAPVTITASTYSVATTDVWIINNYAGTVTLTLPTASTYTGRIVNIQNYQAFTVVSASSNVVQINGASTTSAILNAIAGDRCTLVSNGTNWVMTDYTPNNILLQG